MKQDERRWTYIRVVSIIATLTALGACDHADPVAEARDTWVASSPQDVQMQEVVVVAFRSHP